MDNAHAYIGFAFLIAVNALLMVYAFS